MKRLLTLAALIALTTPAITQSTISPERTRLKAEEADLRRSISDARAEALTLSRNFAAIDGSPDMRREEAASLTQRFPGIVVEPTFDTEKFRKALFDYETATFKRIGTNLDNQLIVIRAEQCEAMKGATKTYAELKASPEFGQMTLEERLALKKMMDTIVAQATEHGDPCLPYVPEPVDTSMLDDAAARVEKAAKPR